MTKNYLTVRICAREDAYSREVDVLVRQLADNVGDLSVGRVEAKRADNGTQDRSFNLAVAVSVKEPEGLLEVNDLLFGEVASLESQQESDWRTAPWCVFFCVLSGPGVRVRFLDPEPLNARF